MKRALFPAAAAFAAVISILLSPFPAFSRPDAEVSGDARPEASATALSAPGMTVFDGSHKEIFSPVNRGELDYSGFADRFASAGSSVAVNLGEITPQALEGVSTYIIAGPTQELAPHEMAALHSFVNRGGNLLVLLHISSPVARLTESFGILVSNFVLAEREGNIEGQAQDFHVTRFTDHPVTNGLARVAVYGTWGLMAERKSVEVATTSDKAWADLNRDRKFDEGEPVARFGIIAISGYGNGKVVVVADDAPFSNRFIGVADNGRLADNIVGWFNE